MPRRLFPLLLLLPAMAHGAAPARPAKLGQGVACHGVEGRSLIPATPHLAGRRP